MQQLPRQEIAYLAALFHDIAKGRGGDHSELGAVDAEAFCLEQGLSPYDARLVAWLVRNHLQLSITAQKQDIGDPQVINAFARQVGDETHLDYLYVLTCADVRGTNPKLWNSWKASLFRDFYQRVQARAAPRPGEPDRPGAAGARDAGRARGGCWSSAASPSTTSCGAWTRFYAGVLPAALARGSRLAHAPAGRARCRLRRAAGRARSAQRARHDRGADLRAAAPPRLRAHHRGARPARAQHRRCAHHADRRWLQPRPLSRARGRRRADHRQRPHERDRARAVALAAAAGGCAVRGLAARAAPGAHVQHPDADRAQRR